MILLDRGHDEAPLVALRQIGAHGIGHAKSHAKSERTMKLRVPRDAHASAEVEWLTGAC
jgi:hypothetical protein